MWNAFVNALIESLRLINGVFGSYGIAIIILTALVRLLTMPLTLQQLRSSKAMQDLQPQLMALQKKYAKDKEKLAREQMKLYREAGVNPAAGCLPMLIQLPIWVALFQALRTMAQAGILQEGFLWIPSLAEPNGLAWLWPPRNWEWPAMPAYLILPLLTMASQFVVQKMISPPTPSRDPQQAAMSEMMILMPLMMGFFAVQVPSGLSLYWVTSNIFSIIQQYLVSGWGGLLPRRKREGEKRRGKGKR